MFRVAMIIQLIVVVALEVSIAPSVLISKCEIRDVLYFIVLVLITIGLIIAVVSPLNNIFAFMFAAVVLLLLVGIVLRAFSIDNSYRAMDVVHLAVLTGLVISMIAVYWFGIYGINSDYSSNQDIYWGKAQARVLEEGELRKKIKDEHFWASSDNADFAIYSAISQETGEFEIQVRVEGDSGPLIVSRNYEIDADELASAVYASSDIICHVAHEVEKTNKPHKISGIIVTTRRPVYEENTDNAITMPIAVIDKNNDGVYDYVVKGTTVLFGPEGEITDANGRSILDYDGTIQINDGTPSSEKRGLNLTQIVEEAKKRNN